MLTLEVVLRAIDQLSPTLKNIEGQTKKLETGFSKLGSLITVGALGIGFKQILSSAEDQLTATRSLESALGQLGVSYYGVKTEIDEVIKSLEKKTLYTDDQQYEALKRLILITGNYQTSLNHLGLALDISSAFNMDMNRATLMLGAALEGNVTKLQRLIPELGTLFKEGMAAEEVIKILEQRVKGQAEAMANTKPIEMFTKKLGEVGEQIGTALLPFVSSLTRLFSFLSDETLAVGLAIGGLVLIIPKLTAALSTISLNPVILAFTALAVGITKGIDVYDNFTKKQREVAVSTDYYKEKIKSLQEQHEKLGKGIKGRTEMMKTTTEEGRKKLEMEIMDIEKQRKGIDGLIKKWEEARESAKKKQVAPPITVSPIIKPKIKEKEKDIKKEKTEAEKAAEFIAKAETDVYRKNIADKYKQKIDLMTDFNKKTAKLSETEISDEMRQEKERQEQLKKNKETQVELWNNCFLHIRDAASSIGMSITNSLGNAIYDIINSTQDMQNKLKAIWRSLGESILMVLSQVIAKMVVALLLQSALSVFFGGFGAAGVFLKGLGMFTLPGGQTLPGSFRTIPGPPTSGYPIIAHGGEVIGRPKEGMMGKEINVNIYGDIYSPRETIRKIQMGLRDLNKTTGRGVVYV